MDMKLLKIASDIKFTKKLSIFSHSANKKNPICGDKINIKINLKKNIIKGIHYETKSCIYCQASASFLSKYFINQNIKKVAETLNIINKYYEGQFILRNKGLIRIFNKDNFKRKECVYLPARAFFKALNLKKNINL